MALNLGGASKLTGCSKSTILRAIRRGAISASMNEAKEWVIDPAELERWTQQAGDAPRNDAANAAERELRARLADAHATIDDLRRQRDADAEERRRLTALLTDQREPQSRRRRPFFAFRLLRGATT